MPSTIKSITAETTCAGRLYSARADRQPDGNFAVVVSGFVPACEGIAGHVLREDKALRCWHWIDPTDGEHMSYTTLGGALIDLLDVFVYG